MPSCSLIEPIGGEHFLVESIGGGHLPTEPIGTGHFLIEPIGVTVGQFQLALLVLLYNTFLWSLLM